MVYIKSLIFIAFYLSTNLCEVAAAAAAASTTPTAKCRRQSSHFLRPWGIGRGGSNRNMSQVADSTSDQQPRRIVVMGGPASGKGTQCEYLISKYGVVHISTGDMLRAAVAKDTSLGSIGALAKQFMDSGMLVPDDVIVQLVKNRISQPDCVHEDIYSMAFREHVPRPSP